MPLPMYFYPFKDKQMDSGFVGNISAKRALHGISPTFGRKSTAFLWKMGKGSSTFASYMGTMDRIYVIGHCDKGEDTLLTGAGGPKDSCSAKKLANIFHDHGLFKASKAHIRIHACNSGESYGIRPSFAQRLKDEMVKLDYRDLTIRGYLSGMGYYFIFREGEHPWSSASKSNNILQFDPPLRDSADKSSG